MHVIQCTVIARVKILMSNPIGCPKVNDGIIYKNFNILDMTCKNFMKLISKNRKLLFCIVQL